MAATCGIVVAACLSGLPAASCAAMAIAYEDGVIGFGLIGLVAIQLLAINALDMHFGSVKDKSPNSSINRKALATIAAGIFLVFAVCECTIELARATTFCLIGNDAAKHQHTLPPHLGWFASMWNQ
jgi:hypothetical protein